MQQQIFMALIFCTLSSSNERNALRPYFIPGKSCGVMTPIKHLDIDHFPSDLSASKVQCSFVKSERDYELIIEKMASATNQPETTTTTASTSTASTPSLYPFCEANPGSSGLILQHLTGHESHGEAKAGCLAIGMQLIVIRTEAEKDALENYKNMHGLSERTYLNGQNSNNVLDCDEQTCGSDKLVWEDGGPMFDTTLYRDWQMLDLRSNRCVVFKSAQSRPIMAASCTRSQDTVCMAKCDGYPEPAGRFQYCEDTGETDLVLRDLGDHVYDDAVKACEDISLSLAVVRTEEELDAIYDLIGDSTQFHLAGHVIKNQNCSNTDCVKSVAWEDGGLTFDASIYDGTWIEMHIDNIEPLGKCLRAKFKDGVRRIDDKSCIHLYKTVCMLDCALWANIAK